MDADDNDWYYIRRFFVDLFLIMGGWIFVSSVSRYDNPEWRELVREEKEKIIQEQKERH
jgi:hypothetical protein